MAPPQAIPANSGLVNFWSLSLTALGGELLCGSHYHHHHHKVAHFRLSQSFGFEVWGILQSQLCVWQILLLYHLLMTGHA